MSLFLKSFSKTSTGSVLSMAFGAVTIKIIAVLTGPQGVGIFSILKDISQTLTLAFSLSGNVAIVKNLSSGKNKNKELLCNFNEGFKILKFLNKLRHLKNQN